MVRYCNNGGFISNIFDIMRRRRVEALESDLKDAIKSEAKGIIGWLVTLLLTKLVNAVLNMIREKGWVKDLEAYEGEKIKGDS